MRILRTTGFGFLMLFFLRCSEECTFNDCLHGSCVDDVCECYDLYWGPKCERIEDPSSIEIVSIAFENIPRKNMELEWDKREVNKPNSHRPDVYLLIHKDIGTRPWYTSEIDTNTLDTSYIFSGPFPEIFDVEDNFRFALVDSDDDEDQELYWLIDYYIYHSSSGRPERQEVEFSDGTVFSLELRYNFD